MARHILLINEFGSMIFTRQKMQDFFRKISRLKDKKIVLDFEDIDFISRSCADEYLKLKKTSKKEITEENLSDKVKMMIDIVKKTSTAISFVEKEPMKIGKVICLN